MSGKQGSIKAIETKYKGYRFRSRTEARWAVFFDALGVKWEYEPEGFVLSNGVWYLPDFYLPVFCGGLWVEVKPEGGDFSTAKQFAKDKGCQILLAEGTPDCVVYGIADKEVEDGDACFSSRYTHSENRMFFMTGYNVMDRTEEDDDDLVGQAVIAARSARFEHGETPSVWRRP
jgi:hypothetical protein